jgi:hypothetical protein
VQVIQEWVQVILDGSKSSMSWCKLSSEWVQSHLGVGAIGCKSSRSGCKWVQVFQEWVQFIKEGVQVIQEWVHVIQEHV